MTKKTPDRIGAFPTIEQELFLQAALLPGEAGLAAWRRWKQLVPWEKEMDAGSFALLPLLYHHLKELGVDDPAMGRFKGVYRKVWYQNRTLLHETVEVLRLFEGNRITTMVLKGAALSQLYYKDFGLRKMHDVDVMIPIANRRDAIDVLTRAGWMPRSRPLSMLSDSNLDLQHAWVFENKQGRQLDLHWRMLPGSLAGDAEAGCWEVSVPLCLEGISTRTLCPTDHLLHACAHGVRWSPTPPLRWVADSMYILRVAQGGIDWDRMIGLAEKFHLIVTLREAFAYLQESFDAEILESVLRELNGHSVSPQEYRYFNISVAPQSALMGELPVYWSLYFLVRERAGQSNGIRAVLGFLPYLRRWKMMTQLEFLGWILTRVFIRVGGMVAGFLRLGNSSPENNLFEIQ
jgi:hypothetical protein